MNELDDAGRAQLDQFAARVRAEEQVDLGSFDEAELLALGQQPVPRVRLGHGRWPAYLGLGGPVDSMLAAAGEHLQVRAAQERLAARGLAETDASGSWRALGQARLVALLARGSNGAIGWFSAPSAGRPDGTALNGVLIFPRWSVTIPGVCLVESVTVRDVSRADEPLPTLVTACTAAVSVRHIAAAVFREPLTPDEREQAPASRCGVVVDYRDKDTGNPAQSLFDFQHAWGASTATATVPGSPPRRTRLGRRPETLDVGQLEAMLVKIVQAFVDPAPS